MDASNLPESSSKLFDEFEYVVAIDIGTIYSAFAFAHKDDINFDTGEMTIICNQPWHCGKANLISLKTPTCVLLNDDAELMSFGFDAENKYGKLAETKEKNYFFFRRFKMNLYQKIPSEGMVLPDVNGRSLLAETVFSRSILALKIKFFEEMKSEASLKDEDVRWVITVPAIWSETAKQFMRKCANLAGITDNHLIIALEPEAASIYCQYVKTRGTDETFKVSKPGTQYMVVDLGGGTVDITVHEKLSNGHLKEIHIASGDECGGNSLNQSLVQEMIRNFGGPFIKEIEKNYPKVYFDVHREFEAAKKAFDLNSDDMSIGLPTIFIEALCKAMHLESLQQILNQGPHIGGLHLSAGNFLHISSELVKEKLFDPTAEKIEQLVSTVISSTNNANITKILLVGGLAESKYIQDFFRSKFPLQTVIIPRETDLCVVKGAVMFGHTPTRISHRVSRYTYGSNFSPTFDNSIHDEKRKRIIDGVDRCVGVFDIFFKMGTVIEIDTNVKRTYVTVDKFQKSLDLSLFASTKENPTYTNEEGCTKIGDYVLVLQNPTEELKRIEVNIVFGNTEISVHAHDASGKLCDISFHYHDNIP